MYKREVVCQIAEWLTEELKPDIYAVLTLKQAVPNGSGSLQKGTRQLYAAAYHRLMVRVAKRIYGTTNYRRTKRLIPNAGTIEGDGVIRFHINACLRCPDWLSFDEFKSIFVEEWQRDRWAMPDMYFEPRTGHAMGYSLKDGPEALLSGSLSF